MSPTPTRLLEPPIAGASAAGLIALVATVGHLAETPALHSGITGLPMMTLGSAAVVALLAVAVTTRVRPWPDVAAGLVASGTLAALLAWASGSAVSAEHVPSPSTAAIALATALAILADTRLPRSGTALSAVAASAAGVFVLLRLFELPDATATAVAPVGTSIPTGSALFLLNLGWSLRRTPVDDPIVRVLVPGLAITGGVAIVVATLAPLLGADVSLDAALTTGTVLAGAMTTGVVVSRRAVKTSASLRRAHDALVSETSYGMVLVDADGTIRQANRSAAELFGLSVEHLVGMAVEDLVPLPTRRRHARERSAYHADPNSRPMADRNDLQIRRADGEVRQVRISLTPLPQPDGPPIIAAAIVDVTALAAKARDAEKRARLLQSTLDREIAATQRLRQIDEAKDLLLSAVSHEVRTPLTVLIGFADMLNTPERVDPTLRDELLARLQAQAHRLGTLVEDLLDLARFQRGDVVANVTPVRLDQLVRHAAESATQAYTRHIVVDVPPVVVDVDAGQLGRVLDNLLSNACKYAPTGHIHVDATVPNAAGRVQLSVEDEGDGIAAEMRTAIFDPFERGSRIDSAQPGIGIGLALVKRLVEANDGGVWVEDGRRAGGARFVVDLPAARPAGPDVPGGIHAPERRQGDAAR